MLQMVGNPFSRLSDAAIEAIPRYLSTIWYYIRLRPRRFFLEYEQAPERFMAPWPFLLLNASIAAGLTFSIVPGNATTPPSTWQDYAEWSASSLFSYLFAVPCGAIAAWLIVKPVKASAMLAAFAFSSAWVPLYLPAFAYGLTRCIIDRTEYSPFWLLPGLVLIFMYWGYLVISLARANFIDGRHLVSFVLITVVLTVVCGTIISLAVRTRPSTWTKVIEDIQSDDGDVVQYSARCDNAIFSGSAYVGNDALVWFEWGDTPALGRVTPKRRYLVEGPAYEPVFGLSPNTTYYNRLVGQSAFGVFKTRVRSFKTPPCVSEPP
jgi:hypothetical protein